MNVDDYLKRFNSINYKEPSIQNLFRLQSNHLLNVPFENLDIHLGCQYESLDLEFLYDKIVNKKRGGFCCELNYLFYWLLDQLGYRVAILACRPYQMRHEHYSEWFSHMALQVSMNESQFIVDVGFYAHNFRAPLKFTLNHIQPDVTGHFKIKPSTSASAHDPAPNPHTFVIEKCANEDLSLWMPLYEFNIKPRRIDEFKPMVDFVKSKEHLRFHQKSICVIHTSYSVLKLVGHKLSEVIYTNSAEKSRTQSTLTTNEVFDAIRNIYGINLDREFEPKEDS